MVVAAAAALSAAMHWSNLDRATSTVQLRFVENAFFKLQQHVQVGAVMSDDRTFSVVRSSGEKVCIVLLGSRMYGASVPFVAFIIFSMSI